jgi:hypothetical protein
MEICLGSNTISNKDLFESLKKFTQQSATGINVGNNSKSHFTLPTKATGEDQSMRNDAYSSAAQLNHGKDENQKHEAQLQREALSNLAQQK